MEWYGMVWNGWPQVMPPASSRQGLRKFRPHLARWRKLLGRNVRDLVPLHFFFWCYEYVLSIFWYPDTNFHLHGLHANLCPYGGFLKWYPKSSMFTGCPKSFCHPQKIRVSNQIKSVSIDSIVKSILIDPRFINFDGAHASDLENVAATRRWDWWNWCCGCPGFQVYRQK